MAMLMMIVSSYMFALASSCREVGSNLPGWYILRLQRALVLIAMVQMAREKYSPSECVFRARFFRCGFGIVKKLLIKRCPH